MRKKCRLFTSPVCSTSPTVIPPWPRAVPKGSLQTTPEEGLSSSVSPQQDLGSLCLSSAPSPAVLLHRRPGPTVTFDLQATRGQQRSQSNCGCPLQDSLNFANGHRGWRTWLQTVCTQTLSSLLLMSLLSLGSLAPLLVRKCNSTVDLSRKNTGVTTVAPHPTPGQMEGRGR